MEIESEINGKPVTITIPDSKYWQDRAKKRVSAYWSKADNVEKALNKRYKEVYKQLEKELYAYVMKHGDAGTLPYTQKHVIAIMKQLKPKIDELYQDEDMFVNQHLSDTYTGNYMQGMYQFTETTGLAYSFSKIDERAVKTAITYPWSGESFSDRIYANKDKLIRVLRTEITNGLIRGDAIQKTARNVSDKLDISRRQAAVLVQTETAAVLTASDKKMYNDIGCTQYQFEATLDNRTSPICREKDQQVYDVEDMTSGLNAPPMHPRCYSDETEVCTDNGWKLFDDVDIAKDKFLSADPEDLNKREFVYAKDFIEDEYEYSRGGWIYHFHNRSIDISVTPDHSMYIINRNHKGMFVSADVFRALCETENNGIIYPDIEDIKIDMIDYSGRTVYCVDLEKWHLLMVRTKSQPEKTMWCGNCRSTTVPYYGDSFGKRISRDLRTGKVAYVPDISYKEWEKRFEE